MNKFNTVEDLLVAAQKIEIGAAKRYMEYSEVARTDNPEIAELFKRLAEEERKHEKNILQLLEDTTSIDLSKEIDTEAHISFDNDINTKQGKRSLYEILAEAVKREEHAFEIYSQIAANSTNDDVQHYAEILAKEELGHAALLRAMRRRVYHEHKFQIKTKLLLGPDKLNTVEEFLINAYILEKSVAKYIDNIAVSEVNMHSSQKYSELIVNQLVHDLKNSHNDEDMNKFDTVSNNLLLGVTIFKLDNLMAECESIYEYYDSFICDSTNEEIMDKALFLAEKMLHRLILIQDVKE